MSFGVGSFSELPFSSLPEAAGGGTTYDDDIAEAGALTDTPVDLIVADETVTDSGALTDTPADTIVANEAIVESGALTDTPVDTTGGYSETVTESGALTDTPGDLIVGAEDVTDSAALTDIPTDTIVANEAIVESGALTDQAVAGAQQEDVTDSGALTDTPADNIVAAEAITESIAATETVTDTNPVVNENVTESGVITDTVSESGGEAVSQTRGGISGKKKRKLRHTKKKEIDEQLEALILDLQSEKKLPKEVIQEVKDKAEKVIIKQGEIPSLDGIKELLQELLPKEPTITDVSRQLQTIQTAIGELMQEIRYVKKYTKSLEELIIILNNDD